MLHLFTAAYNLMIYHHRGVVLREYTFRLKTIRRWLLHYAVVCISTMLQIYNIRRRRTEDRPDRTTSACKLPTTKIAGTTLSYWQKPYHKLSKLVQWSLPRSLSRHLQNLTVSIRRVSSVDFFFLSAKLQING